MVLACCLICFVDFDACVCVVLYFCILDLVEVLVVVNKCVSNILVKVDVVIGEINLIVCVELVEKVFVEVVFVLCIEV